MPVFELAGEVSAPVGEVFAWHARDGAFSRLAPPGSRFREIEHTGGISDGARNVFDLRAGPFWIRWVALHDGYVASEQFRDTQILGPLPRWVHTHSFRQSDGYSVVSDHVDYALPGGGLVNQFSSLVEARFLEPMFRFRHARTSQDIERHLRYDRPRGKVAVSGSTGFIGSALVPYLSTAGHEVVRIKRADAVAGNVPTGCDAVVHLSGEKIAGRWTASKKRRIYDSRIQTTRAISERIARMDEPPRALICASAVGLYGDTEDIWVDEAASAGRGFLADVVRDWENATAAARDAGVRVVNIRAGVVVGSSGGIVAQLRPLMLAGGGVIVGSGDQWVSWIGLDDLVGVFEWALHLDVEGAVNAVSPVPVQMSTFMSEMGRSLRRPVGLRVPEGLLRRVLGESAALVLDSQRVRPEKLIGGGFTFLTETLDAAFGWELHGVAAKYEPRVDGG